jgi:hypothetical protein
MARLLHHGSREGVELIQADAQEQERPGDAIADLRAAGKRLGDLDLTAIIRRVRWQFDRHVQRSAAAEAQAARSAAQVDVLTRQREGQAPRILLHRLCSARQGPSRGSRFR